MLAYGVLSNVPLATANLLAYIMKVLIAFFLIFGPAVAYLMWKKNRQAKAAEPTEAPTGSA